MGERKISPDQIQMAAMYRNASGPEVSRVLGKPLEQVYKSARLVGDGVRPRGRRPRLINPGKVELEILLNAGLTQVEIGTMHKASKRTVQRWIRDSRARKIPAW